jgi:hypothetical protein
MFTLSLLQFPKQCLFLSRERLTLEHSIEIPTASRRVSNRVLLMYLFFFFDRLCRAVVELIFNLEVIIEIRLFSLLLDLLVSSHAKIVLMSREDFLPLCLILL